MSQIEGLNCQLDVPPLAPCARVLDRVLQICRPLIVTLAASGDRLKVSTYYCKIGRSLLESIFVGKI